MEFHFPKENYEVSVHDDIIYVNQVFKSAS